MTDQAIIVAQDTAVHNPAPYFLDSDERAGHTLLLGAGSKHKDDTLWNMLVQDIAAGAGVALIDVTGQYATRALAAVPNHRVHDTYFFDPNHPTQAVGYNPFRNVPEADRPRVAQDIVELFKAIWALDYDRTPLMLRLIRASARVLLDYPDSTMLSMYALLTSDEYRSRVVAHCRDPIARRFWRLFAAWDSRDRRDKPDPVLTRLEAFLSDPRLRNVLGQVRGPLDLSRVVKERQIFLADVSRATLGAETSRLFGCLLLKQLQSILATRHGGWPYYVYVPDAHLLHPALIAQVLQQPLVRSGAVVSFDQVAGYEAEVRSALLLAQNILSFRLAPDDVRYVVARFPLAQAESTLLTLAADRLALSGRKYELQTLPRHVVAWKSGRAIQARSAQALGAPRSQVERKIERFLEGL